MDEMMREVVHTCIPCLSTGNDIPPEPIRMTRVSKAPWVKLHIDFKGPLPGGKYLLVIVARYFNSNIRNRFNGITQTNTQSS